MLDIPTLEDWQTSDWTTAVDALLDRRGEIEETLITVRQQLGGLDDAAGNLAGVIRSRFDISIDKAVELMDHLETAAGAVQDGVGRMEKRKTEMGDILKDVRANSDKITCDDSGYCRSLVEFDWKHPRRWDDAVRWRNAAISWTRKLIDILIAASDIDHQTALALSGIANLPPPSLTDGYLDLSDEGIRYQAELNNQQQYGDCVTLATLMSIANSDPSFIRDHMKWDPESETYKVRIYDENGKPLEVSVSEKEIANLAFSDKKGNRGNGSSLPGSGSPSFLTVYEAAIKKQFGHEDLVKGKSTNFAIQRLTGHEYDVHKPPPSFSEIRHAMNQNPPGLVVAGTANNLNNAEKAPPEIRPVEGHAYSVRGFDSQGKIVLANPWGPAGGWVDGKYCPGEIHLTEAEFKKYYGSATIATDYR